MIKILFSVFFVVLIFGACGQKKMDNSLKDGEIDLFNLDLKYKYIYTNTGNSFKENNGIVSMEAENASIINNLMYTEGKSGLGMTLPIGATKAYGNHAGYLRFHIMFQQAGNYNLYVLSRKCISDSLHFYHGNEAQIRIDPDTTIHDIQLRGGTDESPNLDQMPIDQNGIRFTRITFEEASGNGKYDWRSILKSSRPLQGKAAVGPAIIEIKKPGWHILEFLAANEYGWAIDKVVLNKNSKEPPIGLGPKETMISK